WLVDCEVNMRYWMIPVAIVGVIGLWLVCRVQGTSMQRTGQSKEGRLMKTDEEWQEILTPEQYRVTRQKGTERAFTGEYWNCHDDGIYTCVCCGQPLFDADTKFDSGTGWPSFWQPIDEDNVSLVDDGSFLMRRTEGICSRCDAHLGHV